MAQMLKYFNENVYKSIRKIRTIILVPELFARNYRIKKIIYSEYYNYSADKFNYYPFICFHFYQSCNL